jgi:hypothetical protein
LEKKTFESKKTQKRKERKNGVARWFIFKPKIPIWVNFGGSLNGRCWYIMYMAVWSILRSFWYIIRPFGIFFPHWYIFGMLYRDKSGNPGKQHKNGKPV